MTVEHTAPPLHRLNGWCTIAQAASALGVSRDTIRRMIARGEVYAERLGPRLVRVDLGSIRPTPIGPATAERTVRRPLEVNERIATGGDE